MDKIVHAFKEGDWGMWPILGLLIALPGLTLLADVAGLAGGALIAIGTLDIGAVQFVERVAYSTDLNDFYAGLIKAPFFAFLIAAVGTLRGMQVRHSAEELGRLTTVAVVQSIFLIVLALAAMVRPPSDETKNMKPERPIRAIAKPTGMRIAKKKNRNARPMIPTTSGLI